MPYTKKGSLPAVFNTRDETLHKQLKNPIAPIFSLSNTVTFERFADEVLRLLFHQLDKRYVKLHETFDLGDWLQYFAFDVMGTLTFSKRYGFLENGSDVNGMLQTIAEYFARAAPVSSWPPLRHSKIPANNRHPDCRLELLTGFLQSILRSRGSIIGGTRIHG